YHLDAPGPAAAPDTPGYCVNYARPVADNLLEPGEPILNATAATLLVEIPADISQLKRRRFDLARAWRGNNRQILRHYLSQGYNAKSLMVNRPDPGPPERRTFYVLEKGSVL